MDKLILGRYVPGNSIIHKSGLSIVLVTHLMDDVANYANYVYVLEKGRIVLQGSPSDIFQKVSFLESKQLGVPKVTKFAQSLVDNGLSLERLPITIDELREVITNG